MLGKEYTKKYHDPATNFVIHCCTVTNSSAIEVMRKMEPRETVLEQRV